jgi:hypothetical protein
MEITNNPAMRNLELREQGLCFVEREQKELKKVVVKDKENGDKIKYVVESKYYINHKNDRTDRDICTDCGNKILFGTIDRKLPDIIV